ncbi:hypothetical protein SBA4_1860003 [Candidatus Sulfopaludibacter sp. SbA4]|nr:hypothetical protein SBA4_1860003 [Candidatus Sulfopaludibacter sp. SbA4]
MGNSQSPPGHRDAVKKELSGKAKAGYRVRTPLVPRKGREKIDLTNAEIEDLLAKGIWAADERR